MEAAVTALSTTPTVAAVVEAGLLSATMGLLPAPSVLLTAALATEGSVLAGVQHAMANSSGFLVPLPAAETSFRATQTSSAVVQVGPGQILLSGLKGRRQLEWV